MSGRRVDGGHSLNSQFKFAQFTTLFQNSVIRCRKSEITDDEILIIEDEVKDLDKRISEFQDSRSTKLKELLNQESIMQIKKKDLIKDLKEKVLTVKVLEAKIIENKAEERFEKLDRLQCSHGEIN